MGCWRRARSSSGRCRGGSAARRWMRRASAASSSLYRRANSTSGVRRRLRTSAPIPGFARWPSPFTSRCWGKPACGGSGRSFLRHFQAGARIGVELPAAGLEEAGANRIGKALGKGQIGIPLAASVRGDKAELSHVHSTRMEHSGFPQASELTRFLMFVRIRAQQKRRG